ncbi:MAG: inositol monophosphatase family protein, partial [Janibacter sp.]
MDIPVPEGIDPAALTAVAEQVAIEAGRLIVDERPPGLGVAETKSSATDVVTVMDQRSQDLLHAPHGEQPPQDRIAREERGGPA